MYQRVRATYHGGAFIPREPFYIRDNSEVELIVQGPLALPPEMTDPAERARLLKVVTERMQHNPIPGGAPRLTRDELHERR